MFTDADYRKACDAVMQAAIDKPKNFLLQYAHTYARAGKYMTGEERRVQCLYILNNMVSWRGDEAKFARDVFKFFSKKV